MDAEVSCSQSVLEKIRLEAVDGLNRLAHGGLEVGGLLLGTRTDRAIEIQEALPIECAHQSGPSFILSAADETALQRALAGSPALLQPIGLYVSHCRRGFSVSEADIKILDHYFPEAWQMALILVPAALGPTRAGFFLRGTSAEAPFVCSHEISLSPPERNAEVPASQPSTVVTRAISKVQKVQIDARSTADPQPSPVALAPRADDPPLEYAPVQKLPAFLSPPAPEQGTRPWRRWYFAPALALLLLAAGAVAGFQLRSRIVPYLRPAVHVTDLGSDVRIEWDPAQEGIRGATSGTLEIRDGADHAIRIPVSRAGLDQGAVLYAPRSGMIEARLRLTHLVGPPSEAVVYFVNPSYVAPPPPSPVNPVAVLETVPNTPPPAAKPGLSERRDAKPERVSIERPPVVERTNRQSRPFRPPKKQYSAQVESRALAAPPELPDIRAGQPIPATLPFANAPVRLPARPVATHPPPPPAPSLPREGRLIWTGDLRKNKVLTLSSGGPSEGALNGRLPGFPVRIVIQPAELSSDGIRIFSGDQSRSGKKEAPGARNGWNAVLYKWDPKRASEVTIVDPPGPANDWKKLVVRNGKSNVSVLVVEWQRVGTQ